MVDTRTSEGTHRLRNTVTGASVFVSPGALRSHLGTTIPGTGAYLFEATGRLPGFITDRDGTPTATFIEAADANDVAMRMFTPGYKYSFATGKKDPRWSAARKADQAKLKRQIAGAESGVGVAASRALSVGSFGAYNKAEDFFGGEGSEEARRERLDSHYWSKLGGTLTGFALLGMVPVPGAGKMGGFLGRGGVKGEAAVNVHNLFEIGTASAQGARAIVERGGGGVFAKSLAGTVGGAVIPEAAMSLALASADIVDSDKDWSVQAVLADAGPMFAWGMGLAAGGGALLAGVRGVKAAGKGGLNKVAAFGMGTFARRGGQQVGNTGRSLHPATSAVKQSMAWEAFHWLNRRTGKKTVSPTARFLSGNHLDDYIQTAQTTGEAVRQMGLYLHKADDTLYKSVNKVSQNLTDDFLSEHAQVILEQIKSGNMRKAWNEVKQAAGAMRGSETGFKNIRWRVPEKLKYNSTFQDDVFNGFREASEAVGAGNRKLSRELLDAGVAAGKKNSDGAFVDVLNARSKLVQEGAPSSAIASLDAALVRGTNGGQDLANTLKQMDELHIGTRAAGRFMREIEKVGDHGFNNPEFLQNMRATSYRISRSHTALENGGLVIAEAGDTTFSPKWGAGTTYGHGVDKAGRALKGKKGKVQTDIDAGMGALINMNRMRDSLMENAAPMFPPKVKLNHEQMLETQLRSVIDFKTRMGRTLHAAVSGGGLTAAHTFTGVVHYRQLATQDEKREAFAINREILMQNAASPEQMLAASAVTSEAFAQFDLETATKYSQALMASGMYLMQQMPKSDEVGIDEFSSAEMEVWLERVGALEDPISVIASAADGSVTPEAVEAIRTVYPSLYTDMVLDIVQYLSEYPNEISNSTMIGLDTFTGGALGVLDSRNGVQPPFAQTQMQAQSLGAIGPMQRQQQNAVNSTPGQKLGAL